MAAIPTEIAPLTAESSGARTGDPLATGPSTRREAAQYGVGYVVFAVGRLARDLVAARILGPVSFGIWGALSVYRQYSNFSDFGFTNGLGRVLPRLLQEEEELEAAQAMGAGWAVAMAGTVLFALGIVSRVWLTSASYDRVMLWGMAAVVGLMFLDKHYMYSLVVFRSARRVGESGLWMGSLGALEFVLGVVLIRRFGLYGLYGSAVLALLAATSFLYARQPLRAATRSQVASFRALLVPSLTLMGLGLSNIAIHNVDRVALLWTRGAGQELGRYQVAATLSLVVSQLPCILLTVLIPRLFRFRRNEGSRLRTYFLLPTAIVAILAVASGSLGCLLLPLMLNRFLPKYVLAIAPARILMLGEVCFSIAMVPDTLIVALDRGLQSLLVRLLIIAGGMTGSYWAVRSGYSLSVVATCMCATQACGAFLLGIIAARALSVPIEHFVLVGFGPVLYVAAVLKIVGGFAPPTCASLGATFIKLILCAAALAPLAVLPLRLLGMQIAGVDRILACLNWQETT